MPNERSSETSSRANTTASTSTSANTVIGIPATTVSARTTNKIRTRAATAAAAAASKTSLQQPQDEAEMQAPRSVVRTTAPLDPRTEVSNATAATASTAASAMALLQTKRSDTNTKDIGASRIAPYAPSEGMGSRRTAASRSARSSKRMMLEARRELQLRDLEEARAALETARANKALAKIDLELLESQSEEEEIDEELEREKSTNVERWMEQTTSIADETTQVTKKSETKELADAIISAVKATQPTAIDAPWKYADLPNFNGAHEDWLAFKRSFQDTSAQFTAVQNMARLRKVIQGSAKEAVRSLLFIASDPEEVVKVLERRFGRPKQLVLAELEKIKELHPLGDSKNDICVFSSKISNAVTTIQALNQPQYLYSPEVSQCIIAKLSPIMRHGWIHFEARSDDEPMLVKIKKFLETEAELCWKFALPELNTKKKSSRYPIHATSEKEENVNVNFTAKKNCEQCEENHWITECPKFREASTDKRWETVKKKRLCFLCLLPSHSRRSCKRSPCKKCKRPHHTMLHSDAKPHSVPTTVQPEKPDVTACHQTKENDSTDELKPVYAVSDGKKVYLKMIPVDVYGPKGSARVLALLDEGSTISMLGASVATKIGATGIQEPLTIRTVGGKFIKKKDSQRVDVKIKGVHRHDKRILKSVRTVENLKLASQQVNKEALEKYKHFKGVVNNLSYEQDRPALLIGQDNWGLIITRKIRKGKQNEPVASLTSLGWVLHGYCSGSASPVNFVNYCSTASYEEIFEDLTKPHECSWVPTKENPANDATGQMMIRDFNNESRWFRGPEFLRQPESDWPSKQVGKVEPIGEERRQELVAAVTSSQEWSLPDPQRFSRWMRLLRSTARIFGFLLQLKEKPREQINAAKDETWRPFQKKKKKAVIPRPQKKVEKKLIPIPEEHLQKAERALIKRAQYESFGDDIERIKKNLHLDRSSKLKKFDVLLDDHGVLRLNSRIGKIQNIGSRETKLAILDGRNKIAELLIDHYHRHFCHGNHATVINELRQRYWILSLRNSVKKILHQCQWCRVRKTKAQIPPTGDLPAERLQHTTHPFTCTAVDYFGPMHVTVGRRKEKRWGVLFTCLTTRAVHLELASSLSTSSMIMALRRMAARRGSPRIVYSDNGTNFVGADHELRLEAQKVKRQEVIEAAEREGIQWKYVPSGAPHMAGAWERMVRTVKVALSAVLNERSPLEEVLHTLLTEVEHTVNSRPLTHLSADPEDEESLTPNHFLIGRSCGSAILGDFSDGDLIGKTNWKTAQRLADHFWRRWLREYLPSLMPRKIDSRDITDPERGDIVIVADSSLPRNTWPRGEVVETYVGPDGRTRVVDIRTSSGGVLKRPTSRLIRIVPASSRQEDRVHAEACTGGETVSDEKDRHV